MFKYLGVNFDGKFTWHSHTEEVASLASKRLSLMNILAGSKWGCSKSTLNQTHSVYFLPILIYCCEQLVSPSKKMIDSLEKFHNQALRLITGSVKFTPIVYMLLCTNSRSLSLIIKERVPLLWEKIIRTPGCMFLWDHVSTETECNLKIQKGFVQRVADLISPFGIDFAAQQFLLSRNPIEAKTYFIRLGVS
ncbi:reverse transcriptase domain-containing protein [Caerostris darwini]|uniref:Reverse transcriptase domain-containing protein n=1 Tax=Caerostris darwini TaxID=1538125 RepID=A0AAV4R435_9ARAC|nr:reverse transcriptase domain-containing protein [Caerostris darwini]